MALKPMRTRFLFFFVAVLFVLSLPRAILAAESAWELPELLSARKALVDRDCRRAWDIIWPLAEQNNHEAQYFLWGAMVGGLRAPGDHDDLPRSIRTRRLLTMAAYAALARQGANPFQGDPNHRWARKEIPLMINELALGPKGDQAAQCYASGSSFKDCLKLSVSLGVIPEFEDYSLELEVAAQETGHGARCWRHH